MERCEYCGTPFIKGESSDIGVGFMQVAADEPNCDCYESVDCNKCGGEYLLREIDEHESHCEVGDED